MTDVERHRERERERGRVKEGQTEIEKLFIDHFRC